MFQTFTSDATPSLGPVRLAALRDELRRRGLDGFLVPRADEHQGEYVPPHAERLRWLTGFGGSAGMAVALLDKAAIFVDGRYTLQVRDQVDLTAFEAHHLITEPPSRWIEENLPKGARLGYDPWLHTVDAVERLRAAATRAGGELVPCDSNPLDAVWTDQPAPPLSPVVPHPQEYAGEPASDKIARIAKIIESSDADAAVLTMPDSIAWLFNIRGNDVAHTPLPLSFAIVYEDGHAELFVDERKVPDETRKHLGNAVTLLDRSQFGATLEKLGTWGREVRIDPASCADWIASRLKKAGATLKFGADPVELPKACKNRIEIAGTRNAHIRDGQALSRFLAWLSIHAPAGTVDEISAVKQLEAFRAATGQLREISFDTISGAGANGAIVHYRVTDFTNRLLKPGELFLLDSGAQYLDGTTDVTRTVAIGTPSADQRDRFTRVLKGHIALASARFPEGTSGAQLDVLARIALWRSGIDYDHGTGHGVGSYLSVHEGPQRISKTGHVPLQPGMILSNEPGYYKTGAYGIRIENLLLVQEAAMIQGGERSMLGFETLTLAPIDRALIDADLLSADERHWLNQYHARVRDAVLPGMTDDSERNWLIAATEPV